jgi:hypothetical protein
VKAQWGTGGCLLALKSGMHENEKASLSWADVDMVNSLIRVRAENCSVCGGGAWPARRRGTRVVDWLGFLRRLHS